MQMFCFILLYHSITLFVFFHWLKFKLLHRRLLMLSSRAILILLNSFFSGLISRTVELFNKVIKQVFLLLMTFRLIFPCLHFVMSILFLLLLCFLYVDATAFICILTSSFVNTCWINTCWYMFDICWIIYLERLRSYLTD